MKQKQTVWNLIEETPKVYLNATRRFIAQRDNVTVDIIVAVSINSRRVIRIKIRIHAPINLCTALSGNNYAGPEILFNCDRDIISTIAKLHTALLNGGVTNFLSGGIRRCLAPIGQNQELLLA